MGRTEPPVARSDRASPWTSWRRPRSSSIWLWRPRTPRLMGERMRPLPAALRPHIKAHKSVELARLQLEHGAIGVTTATVTEADRDGRCRCARRPDRERGGRRGRDREPGHGRRDRWPRTTAVDDVGNLREIGRTRSRGGRDRGRPSSRSMWAWGGAGRVIVVGACEVGARRRGARGRPPPRTPRATRVTARASRTVPRVRARCTPRYRLLEVASAFRAEGLPVDVVSAGATGTYDLTGAIDGITEVQAGSYILMDRFHEPLVSGFGFALSVAVTAISVHGDLVVFDAGRKGVGGDLGPPVAPSPGGRVRVHPRGARRVPVPGWCAVRDRRSRRARPGLRADRKVEPLRRLPRRRGGHGGGSLARACAPRRAVIAETIRAGDLSFALDGADLVDVRWGALDVASRIQVTVRDPDWGRCPRPCAPRPWRRSPGARA